MAKEQCDSSDWRCHGSFNFSGGYMLVHQLYKNQEIIAPIPSHAPIRYQTKLAFPNNFNGIRVGFAAMFPGSRTFSYHFYFNELVSRSKTYNGLKFSGSSKMFLGLVGYALNPGDRLTFDFIMGAGVLSNKSTVKARDPNINFSLTENIVDLDPVVGGAINYQINAKFAVKFVGFFDFCRFHPDVVGRVVPALMLAYYPK